MNVIDSSIALQWVLPEAGAAEAVTFYDDLRSIAPDVILVEVANVLAKKVRAKNLSGDEARQALHFVHQGLVRLELSAPLIPRALELSIALSHPVYDCVFLACAEERQAKLVTRDAPFRKRVEDRGYGHLLGEAV